MSKENIGWYAWFPGMCNETVPRDFRLIQYEVSMHKGLKDKKLETVETMISLYLGEVICTGHFLPDDLVYTSLLQKITENESLSLPLDLLSEYSADFDFLVILRRKVLGYECS